MSKHIRYIFILVALGGLFFSARFSLADIVCPEGQVIGSDGNSCVTPYRLLAPLPNPDDPNNPITTFNPAQDNNFGIYLNLMIKIFIGLCAVLSVVMIVAGGIQYMTSELSHSKEAGKERIINAIFGLIIALGAYVLLFTINPDLLKSDITVPPATPPTSPVKVQTLPTVVGDDGKTYPIEGIQAPSGKFCTVVIVHAPAKARNQPPIEKTNEICRATMAECKQQESYHSKVIKSCYEKT